MTSTRPSRMSLPALAAAALFAVASPLAASAQSDPVVAKVNGTEIRESDLTAAEEDIGAQLPPMAPEAKKDYLITYVGDMILVSKAAEAKKLGDTDEFKRKLALARTKLLMEALLQNEAKTAVTDEAMTPRLPSARSGRRRFILAAVPLSPPARAEARHPLQVPEMPHRRSSATRTAPTCVRRFR
jgi:hypothetical protein